MSRIEKWFIKQLYVEVNNPSTFSSIILFPFAVYYIFKWCNE